MILILEDSGDRQRHEKDVRVLALGRKLRMVTYRGEKPLAGMDIEEGDLFGAPGKRSLIDMQIGLTGEAVFDVTASTLVLRFYREDKK